MKILLIDDHALFAKSLSIALSDSPEIEQFTSVSDPEHLESILEQAQPDILLIDIDLGKSTKENGLQLAGRLLQRRPTQKIVILSGYDLPFYRQEAKRIGARGFVNKNIEPECLLRTLLSVQEGAACFPKEHIALENLTATEKQVLQLLAAGTKRKDIARKLFLSERTVSNHLQHIFEKLQVTSAVEAVTRAIQLGYISPL